MLKLSGLCTDRISNVVFHLASAAASRTECRSNSNCHWNLFPRHTNTVRSPEEAIHSTLQPLGEPEDSPLDFSLHLFKLHTADPMVSSPKKNCPAKGPS